MPQHAPIISKNALASRALPTAAERLGVENLQTRP
jgi:hypothetical protein